MKPYLDFGVFTELADENYFKQVRPFMSTIAWPHGQDICPTLYIDGKKNVISSNQLLAVKMPHSGINCFLRNFP